MLEVEVRAIINNQEELMDILEKKGFIFLKDTIQHDIMLDKEDASLFISGKKIRIRMEEDKATLTYKGDINKDKNVSKRTELDIPINQKDVDKYIMFLTELGYPVCFQIKKKRKILKKDDITVTFDEWPIIGCMMEIEGPENEIKTIAKEVAPDINFGNYRLKELFERKMQETGKSLEELKENYFKETQFDLGHIELIIK